MYDCNSIQYSQIWNSPQNFKKHNKEVFEMKRAKTNTIDNWVDTIREQSLYYYCYGNYNVMLFILLESSGDWFKDVAKILSVRWSCQSAEKLFHKKIIVLWDTAEFAACLESG